ncbi:MAG: DegT/DnrJ/EryC1/StrS family aminotransferase [Actinomycetota bacterium]|nr:DegT/DnrJ/EryC1/StrS family aminotransferase [Actinomycetota bacterium]
MRDFIPVAEPYLGGNELKYVSDCIESGWISSVGEYVIRFENDFSKFCGTKYAVATSNGTVAIHLALEVLEVGEGDEVIVPTFTFASTAFAVSYTGARPVFVDSEPATWNIDPQRIEEKITPRTKAIIPVHLYGHPVDMDPLLQLARKHNLYVIEDAAEAHGAEYKGRRVGSLSDVGCFSFYGNKIITTGEGGMLTTDSEEILEKARLLRDVAMSPEKRYWHSRIGFNYRMTNLQAAVGVAQLERIEELIQRKREIAEIYASLLRDLPGVTLPPEASWAKNVYWMYSVLIEDDFGPKRDKVMTGLRERGVDSRPFFYPLHTLPPYNGGEKFPVAEKIARKGINLPSGVTLTKEEIGRVIEALRELRR